MGILWTPTRVGQCTSFQVVLYAPGNSFRHGAFMWITTKQIDHTLGRHTDIQSRSWYLFGKNFCRIPFAIRTTNGTNTLFCDLRIKNGIGPVHENDSMLLWVNHEMWWD